MKNFLNPEQISELTKKSWSVKPKCFRNTFYKDELPTIVWNSLCDIADLDRGCTEVTFLSVGTITAKTVTKTVTKSPAKYYATKKRALDYIKSNSSKFKDYNEFIKEIDRGIKDLLKFNGVKNNPNQLRFFRRVKLELKLVEKN